MPAQAGIPGNFTPLIPAGAGMTNALRYSKRSSTAPVLALEALCANLASTPRV
jgi:hypothetical protein